MGPHVSAIRRTFFIAAVLVYAVPGIALVVTPWALLFFSPLSPLRFRDAAYIGAFGLGVGFVFFLLVGILLLGIAVSRCKLLVAAGRPAHNQPTMKPFRRQA
jgi:hypothetical protein